MITSSLHSGWHWLCITILSGVLIGCGSPSEKQATRVPEVCKRTEVQTELHTVCAEVITSGLHHPWALAFLPDRSMLITERRGRLLWRSREGRLKPVTGVPEVWVEGYGGLLDVLVDRQFETNRIVYLSYAQPAANGEGAGTAIARAQLQFEKDQPALKNLQVLFTQKRKTRNGQFGSRIIQSPDRMLWFTFGDRADNRFENAPDQMRAQDPFDSAGSVLRITPNGSIPADNPFADGKKGLPQIWSIGHRNPQGMIWHPLTQSVWIHEHGARGGDEINRPEARKNYGWPVIGYGRHYSGAKIGVGTHKEGLEQPLHYWDPAIAPSGFAYYDGYAFPYWRGNLFVGALIGKRLIRVTLSKQHKIVGEEPLFSGTFGRIRDVRQGPDGLLYLLTDATAGALIRLRPH